MEKAPHISKDLLDYVQARYPDRCPDLSLSDREFGAYVGARLLVRHLAALFAEQNGLDEPVQTIARTRRPRR